MPPYKILFVGLGKMGFHMAGYLSKNKNFKLFVFNRTKSVEHKWKKKFIAESYNFKNDIKFDFIISCLKDDHAVYSFFNNCKFFLCILIFLINFKFLLNKQILIAVFPISPIKYIY